MQRTHRSSADRKWMPARVRHTRKLYAGGGMAAYLAVSGGALLIAPPLLLAWKAFALGGIGASLVGNRLGKTRFQKQLHALAEGDIPLVELGDQDNGTLVVAKGRIAADNSLRGVLHDAPGVYRRMSFGRWIHEAAVDFILVDEAGKQVPIQAAGARWLMDFRERVEYPRQRFAQDNVANEVRQIANRLGDIINASESVLPLGATVQIVGHKGVRADASGRFVGFRDAPEQAVIQSGPDLPLVISVVS